MWRLVIALGAAVVGYGCNRRQDEGTPAPVIPSRPIPVPPAPPRRPLIPDGFSITSDVPPVYTPPMSRAPAVMDCSRFNTPIAGSIIPDARGVLDVLQNSVMPKLTPHVEEMRAGNFDPVRRDEALTRALASLTGLSILLSDGNPNMVDTLGDWDNLNGAMNYLNTLGNMRADRNSQSTRSRAVRAWGNGNMEIRFRGYKFFSHEITQGTMSIARAGSPFAQETVATHFRIVTPTEYGNVAQFPVLTQCNVDENNYTAISGF